MSNNPGSFNSPQVTPSAPRPALHIFAKHWQWWVGALVTSAIGGAFAPLITAKLPEMSPTNRAIARAQNSLKAAEREDESASCGVKAQNAYQDAIRIARDAQRIAVNASEPVEYEGAGLFALAGCGRQPMSRSEAYAKAADALLKAEKLAAPDPLSIKSCMMLALSLDHAGRRDKARIHYEQVVRRCRNTPDKDKTADILDRAAKATERIEALK